MESRKIKGKIRIIVGKKVVDLDEAQLIKINTLRNVKKVK